MKKSRKGIVVSTILLAAFVMWTAVVSYVDVRPIGPRDSSVGLAGINGLVHDLTGVRLALYNVTDWLGLVPIGVCMGFGVLGLLQWIKRKSICKVDFDILALGVFYIVTMATFFFFEHVVINYRPVLINGCLEASYPSSTTMLTMCVMPTAILQFMKRIKNGALRRVLCVVIIAFIAFMVIGRLVSGVHWLTDIVGGALFSAGLVLLYASVVEAQNFKV